MDDPFDREDGDATRQDRHATITRNFRTRIDSREAVIGIVGLGYVGLPLVRAFHAAGFACLGFDTDQAKVDALRAGRTYIRHIPDEEIAALAASGRFEASVDMSRIAEVDAVILCVPTPLTLHREPDMSFVDATARAIAPHLGKGRAHKLVTLESTTYPTTSQGLLRAILQAGSGLEAGEGFFLAYSPEREDPGNLAFDTNTTPKIVGADDLAAGDMAAALYGAVVRDVVRVSSTRTAEAVKLTENIFRSVNIALVNELKTIFQRMDIDIFEVIDAAKTKPFGFMPFYPGPGIGGHCIPIDPFYLTWKAREYGLHTRFVELAGEINDAMPRRVVDKLVEGLSDHLGRAIAGARVLVVGLAYKKNVDDMRESPSIALIELMEARGAAVDYYDPHIPVFKQTRRHGQLAGRPSIEWTKTALCGFDAAVIATDHDGIDLDLLAASVPLIVDTRNALAFRRGKPGAVIVDA